MANNSKSDKRKPLKLKTGSFDRNAAMARMGVMAGASYATHTFGNLFRSKSDREARNREFYVRQAQFLADELGQLKGSVMKVGQMLSVYGQYFMPPEAIEVLRSLQDDSPPVAWDDLALDEGHGVRLSSLTPTFPLREKGPTSHTEKRPISPREKGL